MPALHALCTGTDAQFTLLQKCADGVKSMVRFKAVITKKYGDKAKPIVDRFNRTADEIAASLRSADFKIDGDNAIAMDKTGPNKKWPKLHKDGDRWRLDLGSIGLDPDQVRKGLAVNNALDTLSDNIEAGKYKDFDEFTADMKIQMTAAMSGTH
jgi:hypothetical protein